MAHLGLKTQIFSGAWSRQKKILLCHWHIFWASCVNMHKWPCTEVPKFLLSSALYFLYYSLLFILQLVSSLIKC
uniref:Ovule protein n=1 Tax=Romanomermis culicivorax TaxID=13658 RepID=A0A915I9F8_ROMCU